MNLLVVADGLYPDYRGGSQTVIYESSSKLCERGWNITLVGGGLCQKTHTERLQPNLTMIRVPESQGGRVLGLLRFLKQLMSELKQLVRVANFDAVMVHHVLSGLTACTVLKVKKKIYFFHSPWHREYEFRKQYEKGNPLTCFVLSQIAKQLQQALLKQCDQIWVQGESMKQEAKALLDPKHYDKITIQTSGVDTQGYRPAENRDELRRELGIQPSDFLMITVRRLVPRMGLTLFLEALPQVVKTHSGVSVLIAGSGPLHDELQAKAAKLGLSNHIRFLGQVEDQALIKLYQAADLFVLPTVALEGLGMVVLESMACGTPVIATPVGGARELLLDFNSEMLCHEVSSTALTQKMINILKQYDPDLRHRCREFIEAKYSWDHAVERIEQQICRS